MRCTNCGRENMENSTFCSECGMKLETANAVVQPQPPVYQQPAEPVIPPEYRPISAWGYFGYQLLFSIPIAGLVLLIVFSCGTRRNKNLKNFARSHFCGLAIAAIIAAVMLIAAVAMGGSLAALERLY